MTLEVREFEIRSFDEEERVITGIAVPFNETASTKDGPERIERGAFDLTQSVPLYYRHDWKTSDGLPIGKTVELRETEHGIEIKAKISNTEKANEVYQLIKDKVLEKLSIGFFATQTRKENGVLVRTKGQLMEVSVVHRGAYPNASVVSVREQNTENEGEENMSDTNDTLASEVAELRDGLSDLERKFTVAAERNDSADASIQYRSMGELVKALSDEPEKARMEVRAFTGSTTADTVARPAWLDEPLKLVDEQRPITNLFRREALQGGTGVVEYPKVTGVAGTVGVQAAEGDDLPYMEVTFETAAAMVKTYGGYSALSRQAIELSSINTLNTVLRAQTLQYAKATEKAVRDALVAATGVNTGTLATDDAEGWIDLVIDSAALIEDNSKGEKAEFVLMSRDVYKRVAHMTDTTGRPLFTLNGDGANTIGGVNVRNFKGSIAGLPIVVDNRLPANSVYVAARGALLTLESPGAPFRLQDENVINLTKEFSLYGYMAIAVVNPLAIVRVDADLVA